MTWNNELLDTGSHDARHLSLPQEKILNIVQYIARAGNINIPNRFANMLETKVSSFWRPKYLLGEI